MAIEIADIDVAHEGWSRYLIATVRLPDGQTVRREIEDHGTAACVLPYDPVRRTAILVSLFRAPVHYTSGQEQVLEAIAGLVESPDPMACARREALEEAGLKLGTLEPVVTAWSMPGVSTERMNLYFATYRETDRVGSGGGVAGEHENIAVVEMRLGELAAMADDGRLEDMKTLLLVQTLRLRRPELFTA